MLSSFFRFKCDGNGQVFPAAAMILLAVVSAVCYKGMRAIENKLKAKKEKSQK